MSRGFNFRLWCLHRMLLTHVIIIIITVTAILGVRAQDVLSMSHEIKARIEPPEDVPQPQRPVITSRTSRLHVLIGSMVFFPCKVENLGSNVVVVWKRGLAHVLFTGNMKVDQDPSISLLNNNSLKIRSVMPEHAGTYICSVRSSPAMELEHYLEVLVPPKVKPIPPDGQIVAKKDDSVTLECRAEGHPSPMITWRTAEGSLPRGISEKQGSKLTIPSVDTYHSGEYQCKADNEVGDPVTARFKVKILYSPEITVKPTWVHAGLGSSAEFSCSVSAEPSATIRWTKSSGPVLEDNHIGIRKMGSSSEVKIRRITKDHLETYNCTASNFLGSSYATVEVSGLAEPASIQSNSTGEDDTSFLLLWTVKSYSPVIEYVLNVRRRKEDSARDKPESAWIPVMIPIDIQQSLFHSQSYNVTGLEPATAYEAIIQARNEYGWNHPSDTFVFYTYGREQSQDVMEEQPFEPTTLLHPVTNLQDKKEGQEEKENIVEMEVKRNIARRQVMDYMTSMLIIFSALAVLSEL